MQFLSAAAAVVGLASAAAAQAPVTIRVNAPATVHPGETFTVTTSIVADVDDVGTIGYEVSLTGAGNIVSGPTDLLGLGAQPTGFIIVDQTSTSFVAESFVAFFGNFARDGLGANGEEAILSFEVTAGLNPGAIDFDIGVSNISIPSGANDAGFPPNNFEVNFVGASTEIVPTPGAAAVLGMGGLLAARRRR